MAVGHKFVKMVYMGPTSFENDINEAVKELQDKGAIIHNVNISESYDCYRDEQAMSACILYHHRYEISPKDLEPSDLAVEG